MQPAESRDNFAFINVDLARDFRRVRNATSRGSNLIDCELNFCVQILVWHARNLLSFEVLHRFFVFLGRGFRFERAEVAAFAGLRIFLSRIQSVTRL